MVRVMPFRGLRYDERAVGDWGAMLSPPYDIVDATQVAELTALSPYQISHIETAWSDDGIAAAARRLQDWRTSGVIVRDDRNCYYLHEHRFVAQGREQTRRALFAAVELSQWGEAGVMGHERTMPGPKATRAALRSVAGADVSPLLAFVPDPNGAVAELINVVALQPPQNVGIDPSGDTHTLRVIDDPGMLAAIEAAFTSERIYMADGHHRYESALASMDHRPGSHRVLMGIVCAQDAGLVVGATHRVVHTPAPAWLPQELSASFVIKEIEIDDLESGLPDGSATLGLITNDGVWVLEPRDAARGTIPTSLPFVWRRFAPALLQYAILEPVFGIDEAALAGARRLRTRTIRRRLGIPFEPARLPRRSSCRRRRWGT